MSYLTEQAAYLKGLFDGGDFDTSSKEGKLLESLISVIGDIADEMEEAEHFTEDLQNQVDEIDEALASVEDEVYGCCDEGCEDDDEWDADEDDELAVECPGCGEMIYLDPALLEDEEQTIICPNCKEEIELEITDDDCDCGCGDDK